MPQSFYLEVNSESDLKANISSPLPRFQVTGLQAGTHYVAYVFAANMKGRSDALNIDITTLGNSERILNLKEGKIIFTAWYRIREYKYGDKEHEYDEREIKNVIATKTGKWSKSDNSTRKVWI